MQLMGACMNMCNMRLIRTTPSTLPVVHNWLIMTGSHHKLKITRTGRQSQQAILQARLAKHAMLTHFCTNAQTKPWNKQQHLHTALVLYASPQGTKARHYLTPSQQTRPGD